MKLNKLLAVALAALTLLTACGGNDEPNPNPNPEPTPTPTTPALSNQLIYEANPLFFASNNCLNAITARLDDIEALGTKVLWIMPIYTPGQKNAIGSPYCVKDYKGINPKYGTMADLKALVDNAHRRGMIVILDWVANHTAWDNAWITEHPQWFLTNSSGNIISPPGQNWADVAQLNYNNADMRLGMIDAMTYWIKEAGVDGFRCDYASGVPHDFWQQAIKAIHNVKADAFMLAEASDFNLYTDGFDMIYDWTYGTDLQQFYHGKMTFDKLVERTAARDASLPKGKNIMRYVVNHDVISEKSPQELFGSPKAMPGAYALTAFIGGIPMVYSGMEAGFDGRTAFINAKPLTWNATLQAQYAAIGRAYDATATARAGKLSIHATGSKAVVFSRTNGANTVLVMVNPTAQDIQVKTPMVYAGTSMRDMMAGSQTTLPTAITIPAYGFNIYTK